MRDAQSLLQELRRRLPVLGLRQAQQLLTQAGGDLDAAEALFRQHAVATVVQRAGVDAAVAAGHLQRGGYDIHAALTSIEAARYTLTERILRRYQNQPGEALSRLLTAVEYANGLKRSFWLKLEELQPLNGPQYCFTVLCEWLNYVEWEGESGLFHDQALPLLRQELPFPELADCVQALNQRFDELYQQHAGEEFETRLHLTQADETLQRYEAQFEQLRPALTPRLIEYVRQHIGSFP